MQMPPLIPLLLGAVFFFLLDLYVFSGVNPLIQSLGNPTARLIWRIVFWATTIIGFGAFVTGISLFGQRNPEAVHRGMMGLGIVILMVVPKLVFLLFMLGEDVVRIVSGLLEWIGKKSEESGGFLPERRKFVAQAGLAVAAIPFAGILHGITRGRFKFTARELTLKIPNLPEAFQGFRMVQISDIHSGSFDNRPAIERGVDLINAQEADVIFFTGDLVNNFATEIEPWIDLFGRLKAPHGVFSITGNHDYGDYSPWPSEDAKRENFQRLIDNHGKMGFRLLMNEHVKLEKDGAHIALAGVENWGLPPFPQHGDLNAALKGTEDSPVRILLSHDPSHWDAQVRDHPLPIDLTLSGHTHGMQFGIEIPGFRWSPVSLRYPRWAGLYSEGKQHLYVNRGFGYIAFPGRVGIWPEVTVITLEKELA